MSIAGIRSNRGDGYQRLVAFDWALTVLSDPDFEWIEVDSTDYSVDDVVVEKTDGTLICCQCKKNEEDFKPWTIAKLAGELDKAISSLSKHPNAEVCFYSRNNFGALGKLQEYSTTQANEANYLSSLGKEQQEINADLAKHVVAHAPALSTYDFLRRTKFETSPELDRMADLLRERLRYMASNSNIAFNALWTRLDQLGARIAGNGISAAAQHRLTKAELKEILHQAGAMLVPSMNLAEVRASFVSTSTIGRSWHRDIAGERIPSPIVNTLLAAIDDKKSAILLTGLPGSGKTCVMLALQEALEQRAQSRTDLVPLFIQSREFADFATAQDRQAQGLPEQWVEKVARMAEDAQVVVVIDSLDVLSIAREHSVLTYFLAQIDRLLLIPNVTVITACRDFDRHYDRRIAERKWDREWRCLPLSWEAEIAPLLNKLDIDTTSIDTVTRELIQNPRELALFVELARQSGSFNVVNSQALAQRYLKTIVQDNRELGDVAMQAIEAIADDMLNSRSLAVPHQRVTASPAVQRQLRSLNVLQETQDGKITFGHQTLLDVLVISGAVRRGMTLNAFIQGLSPVPFVRPSIRSFVAQLATGERREFRKQLRTVLTGNAPFHIRRLVAESFAEQQPQAEDWSLLRDLRKDHREVFQVIYTLATRIEWHHFWFAYLLPMLKDARDGEGLTTHVYRVAQWKDEDAARILEFWMETLSLDWVDSNSIAHQLAFHLNFKTENLSLLAPLLEMLLRLPQQEHSFLGAILARCVDAGVLDDNRLWDYIIGDICEEDVMEFHFDNKLRCQTLEIGSSNDKFIRQRMMQSVPLLDLAVATLEEWSRIKSSRYDNAPQDYRSEFLDETSYSDTHTQTDYRHIGNERILLDAMEAAILHHAKTDSDWWQSNRERLCFNPEGALRYFAILACTAVHQANIALIGRMLCVKKFLESSLAYEFGTLMKVAFVDLDESVQDAVMSTILTLWHEHVTNEHDRFWIHENRVELIVAIPCHLRTTEAQAMLDAYEKTKGVLVRQPSIGMRGGTVRAPFSFDVFLNTHDHGVLRLLAHYSGHDRGFDDFLVGGEREVGWQLHQASSRHPARFLQLLSAHWADISKGFCDDIMGGVADYLSHRYGNLQTNGTWLPLEEPDAQTLCCHILDELERHPLHWLHNRSASKALQACAHVVQDTQNAARLVFLAIGFANLKEENAIKGDTVNLLNNGINMVSGHVVESLMILANGLQEHGVPLPELLPYTLRRFANHEHPSIRALILRRLPYLQSQAPELGWALFHLAMQDAEGLWQIAEPCLYYASHNHFEQVMPYLARLRHEGGGNDLVTWGRISALAALSKRIDFAVLLEELKTLNSTEAWQGAASIWTYAENLKQHREQCLAGIEAGLELDRPHAMVVAQQMSQILRGVPQHIPIPIELVRRYFSVFESDSENKNHNFIDLDVYLNHISAQDAKVALETIEIYLAYVSRIKPYLCHHSDHIIQLITRLFAEAEELEESDQGAMLQRVVSVQDKLLALGVNSVNDWLKAAERP